MLFLGKRNDPACAAALQFAKANFGEVTSALGGWNEPMNSDLYSWDGDWIISYLSRWVVPPKLIEKARKGAINFHPASPAYPGIGCNNFALYDGAKEYGVTCHFMAPVVDTGKIIATRMFPVLPSDTVASLLARTYTVQLALYYEIAGKIAAGETLQPNGEEWLRKPYSRKEFNALGKITPDMEPEEVRRRIRATDYPPWGPTVEVGGFTFQLKSSPVPA